jgi:hypothetical protein
MQNFNQGRIDLRDRDGLRNNINVILKNWGMKFWTGVTET